MAACTVRYLLQQGYAPGQLVVLTPYLGQLLEVQSQLSRVARVELDERDKQKLTDAGAEEEGEGGAGDDDGKDKGNGKAPTENTKPEPPMGVRVATIDNYQVCQGDYQVWLA